MTIKIYRFAASTGNVQQYYTGTISTEKDDDAITVMFSSGGKSRRNKWEIEIGTSSFKDLARAMMLVEPDIAIRAFGAVLKDY